MTPETIAPWVSLALSLIALVGIIYGWLTRGEKTVAAALDKHKEDAAEDARKTAAAMADMERRVLSLEGELRHLPDRNQAHNIELALEKLNGRIEVLATQLEPVSAIADRWQELILEQAKK